MNLSVIEVSITFPTSENNRWPVVFASLAWIIFFYGDCIMLFYWESSKMLPLPSHLVIFISEQNCNTC